MESTLHEIECELRQTVHPAILFHYLACSLVHMKASLLSFWQLNSFRLPDDFQKIE